MRSLIRIALMVVVSLLTLTIGSGGYAGKDAFEELGIFAVLFGGLPVLGLITLFHSSTGPSDRTRGIPSH